MKKILKTFIPGLIILSFLIGSTGITYTQTAHAETDDRPSKSMWNIRGDKDKREDDDKEKGNFFEHFRGKIEKITKKLTATHDRIFRIAERIETRAEKLSKEGVKVEVSLKFVSEARNELKKAKLSIQEIETTFKAESNNNLEKFTGKNARTVFTKTITNISDAKEHLKMAHRNLANAVKNLKPGRNTDNKIRTDD